MHAMHTYKIPFIYANLCVKHVRYLLLVVAELINHVLFDAHVVIQDQRISAYKIK